MVLHKYDSERKGCMMERATFSTNIRLSLTTNKQLSLSIIYFSIIFLVDYQPPP